MPDEEMRIIMDMAKEVSSINEAVKSAHHRIAELRQEVERVRDGQNWLPKLIATSFFTTVIGGIVGYAISTMVGA